MFNKEKYLKDLESLVSIDCGTYTPKGTKQVSDILAEKFKDINFKVKIIDVGNKVGPLLIAYNKECSDFDVVLVGHMDTVYQEGLVAKHPMEIKGDKIFGLGTIDMKSGLLQGLYAIEGLDKEVLGKLSIGFIFNPDEEISSLYSENEIAKIAKQSKCALILESAGQDGVFVNKRKGIARFIAKFHGLSAHASTPEKGASAAQEMAHFMIRLEEFYNQELSTTFNVSPLKSEGAGNVISHYAEMEFEIRFLDTKIYDQMKTRIDEFVKNPVISGVTIEIELLTLKPALNNLPENQWIEDLVMQSAKSIGLDFDLITSGGGSDGNYISYIGVPTMDGIGPVGGAWHNADNEHLDITSVESRIKLLQTILVNLSKR